MDRTSSWRRYIPKIVSLRYFLDAGIDIDSVKFVHILDATTTVINTSSELTETSFRITSRMLVVVVVVVVVVVEETHHTHHN